MDYTLELLPGAEEDIDEIAERYKTINDELSIRFLNSLEKVLRLIELHPLIFQKIKHNFRKVNLQVFPYKVVYKVKKKKVVVTAVVHHKRHPKHFMKRKA